MSICRSILILIVLVLITGISYAQFQYRFYQQVPVVQGDKLSKMPWAGGLNASQYNVIDLNNDGTDDLMIFDRDNNKALTFLSNGSGYAYNPEYEHLFPIGLEHWVLLRDYNCDGRVDLFTSSVFGMSLYENISSAGGQLEWLLVYATIYTEGANGPVNLQLSSQDLPAIADVDGDGDLDILAFNFAVGGGVHFHKNMSVERTGSCGLDLVRTTKRYGDFEECTCEDYVFGSDICNSGGRLQHSGGKSLASYNYSSQNAQDLVIGQENCQITGFLQNMGSAQVPQMTSIDFDFPNNINPITLTYPAIFNVDVNFDGQIDLLVSNNEYNNNGIDNYAQNNWFYEKSGTEYILVTKAFLQEEMIDVGHNAAPALADFDADGDEDLIIGTGSQATGASLVLYENDGDALNPRLIKRDTDYLFLATQLYQKLSPQFLDVNNNGQEDLIIKKVTSVGQSISIYWHTNNLLQPYTQENSLNLSMAMLMRYDNPFFYISGSKLALLIGSESGKVSQYINQGTVENPIWELVTDAFLNIVDNYKARNPNLAIDDMDGDGKHDLIIYDDSGKLRIYSDYKGVTTPIDNIVENENTLIGYNSSFGTEANISTTLVTGAKLPSIIIGLKSGGLQMLANVEGEQRAVKVDIKIAAFPNPVNINKVLSVVGNQDVEIEVVDMWGHSLTSKMSLLKGVPQQIDVIGLRAGLYVILAYDKTGKKSSAKFVITE